MTARIENTVHSYLLQPFTFLHPKKSRQLSGSIQTCQNYGIYPQIFYADILCCICIDCMQRDIRFLSCCKRTVGDEV